MILLKLFSAFVITTVLSGCSWGKLGGNIDDLRGYIKLFRYHLAANPAPTNSAEPGVPTSTLTHYLLLVKKVPGSQLYQGKIASKAIEDGYQKCLAFKEELMKDEEWEWLAKDYKCYNEQNHRFEVYTFEIEGDGPTNDTTPELWHNILGSRKLQKGEIKNLFATQDDKY